MNASSYLQSFGWKEGEALQKGGLKKPILVKHKKDTKGLGSDGNDADLWWERLFDGQLKNLDVTNGSSGVIFERNTAAVMDSLRKSTSPLYKMFVKGEGLAGTVGKTENAHVKSILIEAERVIESVLKTMGLSDVKEEKKSKKKEDKKDKKEKRKTKLKAEKNHKKSKDEKKQKKEKLKEDKKKKRSKEEKKEQKIEKVQEDKNGKFKVVKKKRKRMLEASDLKASKKRKT